jgi:hypothetical protein
VAQRRYQGVGQARYQRMHQFPAAAGVLWESYSYYRPILVPFFNPDAVCLAGLDMSVLLAWCAANPDEVFFHPTYRSLCLRWGDNPHNYIVTELKAEPTADGLPEVCFTPHTCWYTGTTFYQLAIDPADDDPLLNALCEQAGLRVHEREQGAEGTWGGWCGKDQMAI